jgi:hypothetical protein
MEPHRSSIVRRLIWASIGLLGVASIASLVWVMEANRRQQQRREMALVLERKAAELRFDWLMVEAERQRVEHAVRLRPGGSWLCERVPCNDLPLQRPEDGIPRLLRAPTLVGDGPRPPERW